MTTKMTGWKTTRMTIDKERLENDNKDGRMENNKDDEDDVH